VVAFPSLSQLPPLHVQRTNTPIIQSIRFVEKQGKVVAEIRLEGVAAVQKHYRISSPTRIVLDIVRQSEGATDHKRQAVKQAPESVASAPPVRQAPPPVVGNTALQESKRQRAQPSPPQIDRRSTVEKQPDPDLPRATLSETELLHIAERQWQQGQFSAAQRSYQKFLAHFPGHAHNHLIAVRLADMLQNQRQYRTALEAYADVITTYPGSEGAIISEMRMAELGIQDPELLPRDGDLRFRAYHSPIEALRLLIQKYPMNSLADVARFKLGVLQLQRHQAQAALTGFAELLSKPLKEDLRLEVQVKYREALQNIMAAFHSQGQYAEVLHTFFVHKGMLAPHEAESPDFLLPLALSYARLGLFPEAQSLFKVQRAAPVTPQQRSVAALEQAHALVAEGLLQDAKKLLQSALPGAEGTPREQMLLALGRFALQTGQPTEAVHYLRQGLETASSPAERATLFAHLGEGYAALGQEKEGLQAFQQCKEIATAAAPPPFPIAATCLFRVAELLLAQRQYSPALAAYQQLLADFPQTGHRDWVLLRIATLARRLPDLEQMQNTLAPLQETSAGPLWQKVAAEALEDATWQQQFHERLAEFQNTLMR
jgi:tetratricopeptide (TPR) repeat protein